MIDTVLLSAAADTKYAAFSAEAWAKAAEVAIFGMAMVFLVLAILWGVLAIFKLFAPSESKAPVKGAQPKEEKVSAPPAAVAPSARTDDSELIAVLTAAIAAYRASEEGTDPNTAGGFRVVSFKRTSTPRSWNSGKNN